MRHAAPLRTPPWLQVEYAGPYTFLRFTEPIALTGERADAAHQALTGLLGGPRQGRLVVDFGNVTVLSSLMVAHLHASYKQAQTAGVRLALCRVQSDLRAILDITWVTRLVPTYDDVSAALEGLAREA